MTTTPINTTNLYPYNLQNDKNHTLDGMLVLRCLFCETYQTPIEFDISNHLREIHHKDLIIRLPLHGTGYDMGYRAQFAIGIMKDAEPKIFYDHTTATFAPPVIPVSAPPRCRAYDKYKVKKDVAASRKGLKSEEERKETCLLPLPTDIEDSSDYDSTVTPESD